MHSVPNPDPSAATPPPEGARFHAMPRPASRPPEPAPEPTLMELLRRSFTLLSAYLSDLGQLWRAEMQEEGRLVRSVLMMAGLSALLLFFSFGLLTVALVGLIAYGLSSWRWSLLIVGVAYGIIGALLLGPAMNARRAGIERMKRVALRVRDDFETVRRRLAA